MGFAAGILVFLGFRFNVFSFYERRINLLFLFGAGAFLVAVGRLHISNKGKGSRTVRAAPKSAGNSCFAKNTGIFTMVTMLHGVQKQIAVVFGSWVIIELLGKKADTMSLLMITVSFISIFFMRMLGHWIDRFGVKKMMYLDALTFIFIYIIYGFVVWGITGEVLTGTWPVLAIYVAVCFGSAVDEHRRGQVGLSAFHRRQA